MIDEAIKSIRTLFYSALLVYLIWLVTWSTATQRLQLDLAIRDLHTWLYLRERVNALREELDIFELPFEETISVYEVVHEGLARQGGDFPEWRVITVRTTWPDVAEYPIALTPRRSEDPNVGRIYGLQSGHVPRLKIADYEVAITKKGKCFVFPQGTFGISASGSARGFELLDQRISKPRLWDATLGHLARHGFHGEPSALTLDSPSLVRLRNEVDPRSPNSGVTVFGIQLSISMFFSSVGILLGAIAFAMTGPLARIKGAEHRSTSQPWVMVLQVNPGWFRRLLEPIIALASIAWAAFPLLIMGFQWSAGLELIGVARWTYPIGLAGLAIAAIAFALVALEMRAFRIAIAPPTASEHRVETGQPEAKAAREKD